MQNMRLGCQNGGHFKKKVTGFPVARLVDLTSVLFEIPILNFKLVSPLESQFGLSAPLLQNYPFSPYFATFGGKYLVIFYSS